MASNVATLPDHAERTTESRERAPARRGMSATQRRNLRLGLTFISPWIIGLAVFVVYPVAYSIYLSFTRYSGLNSPTWVGFQNYQRIFASDAFWQALLNNVLWVLVVPAITVAFGLAVAVLADKLSAQGEKTSKSMIFLPMAISFVGASTIWGTLIYAYDRPGTAQTGLLNAVVVALGGEPQTWLQISDYRLNSLLMMVILIWMQAGFAMVLLSGAIKGVPEDTLEAARIDGANERQVFFRIIIPQIQGTIITVFITVVILVLKVFDIVYVLTNGQNKTNVIALMFFQELFTQGRAGRASAIVVILLILVTPILIYQVRHYRKEQGR